MKLPISPISQRDSRWKDKLLGTSTVSKIGDYGCLLTSATMACKYFGKDTDPAKLNDDMVRVKGFYNGSYWVWGKVNEVYSDINFDWDVYNQGDCEDKPAPLDLIDKLLAEGIPVIVKVDYTPGGDVQEHWVLIIGKEGDYLINDPWTGETYYFTAKYGDPSRYIFRICAYRGTVNNKYQVVKGGITLDEYDQNPKDIISDFQAKVESVKSELADKNQELTEVLDKLGVAEKTIADQERDNKDLVQQALTARGERDSAVRDKKIADEKIAEQVKTIEMCSAECTELSRRLSALSEAKLEDFSSLNLLQELLRRLLIWKK